MKYESSEISDWHTARGFVILASCLTCCLRLLAPLGSDFCPFSALAPEQHWVTRGTAQILVAWVSEWVTSQTSGALGKLASTLAPKSPGLGMRRPAEGPAPLTRPDRTGSGSLKHLPPPLLRTSLNVTVCDGWLRSFYWNYPDALWWG